MKKLFFASAVLLGSMSMYSCDGGGTTTEEGTVVDTDTTVTELEVERTTMEVDTTMDTETETIELED
ncbi:hypothetical protein [Pontibacter pamirensis]|uniref:hypothetical protein n=1 Tax=Pontibacter pamirensis TaxID=2562824 RepID=UPI001389E22B|nr:hypothetical protein [Pontibacter pamirensis]